MMNALLEDLKAVFENHNVTFTIDHGSVSFIPFGNHMKAVVLAEDPENDDWSNAAESLTRNK
jgi:hypothetical protein